jgi:hypothetical protein
LGLALTYNFMSLDTHAGPTNLSAPLCDKHPDSFSVYSGRPPHALVEACYDCWRERKSRDERERRSMTVNRLLASSDE